MSAASRSPASDLAPPDVIGDHVGIPSRYLTDGVTLYRYVGTIASPAGDMIGLENCRSLDVTLWPVSEIRVGQLRRVTPAAAKWHAGRDDHGQP
jgi:hypothetical protein